MSDVALRALHPEAEAVWTEHARILSDRLPSRGVRDEAEHRQFLADVFVPWVERRRTGLAALRTRVAPWTTAPDPRLRLFSALVLASLETDTVVSVRQLPPPEVIARMATTVVEYRATLDRAIAPNAARARDLWGICVATAGEAPWATSWIEPCRSRRAEMELLAAAETQTPDGSRPTRRQPPELPAECTVEETWPHVEAPPPRMGARPVVAVTHGDDPEEIRFTPQERDRLLELLTVGVRRWLRGRRVLPRDDVRRAERLRSERRLREGGPVCGQAPPLAAILAERHPHLWLAEVDPICFYTDTPPGGQLGRQCTLQIGVRRAGSSDRTGLPEGTSLDVPNGESGGAEAWLRAAETLGVARPSSVGLLGMLMGRGGGYTRFSVRGASDDDPWLRVGPTLNDAEEALTACLIGNGLATVGVRFAVSPTGDTSEVRIEPRAMDGVSDPDRLSRCVADAIDALALPCTHDGRPAVVEALVCMSR